MNTTSIQGTKARRSTFDYSLLLITLCLIGFGLLMIYSASTVIAQKDYSDSAHFLKKQAIGVAVGMLALFIVYKIPYKFYTAKVSRFSFRVVTVLYILAATLQVFVLVKGIEVNGAKRWLSIGGLSIQPSEITKVVVIIYTAYFISRVPHKLSSIKGIIRVFLPIMLLVGLVAKENLSTAIVIFAIPFIMCFIAAKQKRWYVILMCFGIACIVGYIYLGDEFRSERIRIWREVETHPLGYQIRQGLYGIASGGYGGKGLGESMQKVQPTPESYNDMIFTVICEELGMIGAGIVLIMFVVMIWRILNTAMKAPDLLSSMICTGVLIHIAVQVVLNVAVVTNTIPSTGVPLPFISYGGTSISILMAEMGLVLGISTKCKVDT